MRKVMRQGDYTTQHLGGSNGDLAELQQIRGRKKINGKAETDECFNEKVINSKASESPVR